MATEERLVKILAWPKDPARLSHQFEGETPCPVSITFEKNPAHVKIETSPERPFHVSMDTHLSAERPLPVCIAVCEPICAESDYRIGLTVFDQPTAAVTVQGRTRIHMCREPAHQEYCVDFNDLKAGQLFRKPFTHHGLVFTPSGGPLRATNNGAPSGQMKLGFVDKGARVAFPSPLSSVKLTANSYAGTALRLRMLDASNHEISGQDIDVVNDVRTVELAAPNATVMELSGGRNEAAMVQICYRPAGALKAGC